MFVVVTTSLERTARLLGRSRGDDIARFTYNDYEHAAALEGGIWNTAQDWVEEKEILEHRPLKIAPWTNLIIIPMIERIKHILITRDIYLGLLVMPKTKYSYLSKGKRTLKKRLTKYKEPCPGVKANG